MNHQNPIQLKIIVVGASGAGKSAIISRYMKGEFKLEQLTTIGADLQSKLVNVNNQDVNLTIWDTAGQEQFKAITRQYYKGSDGAILVYDINDRRSFEAVNEFWLEEIKTYAGNIPILLIGNKLDLQNRRFEYIQLSVPIDEGLAFSLDKGISFIETSSKTGENINQALSELLLTIVKVPSQLNGTGSSVLKRDQQQLSWCQRLHRFFFS